MNMFEDELEKARIKEEEFRRKLDHLDNEMKNFINNSLQPLFDSFFKAYPVFKAINWVQYTPYFNDGEPCYFGVRDISAFLDIPEDHEDDVLFCGYASDNYDFAISADYFYGFNDRRHSYPDDFETVVKYNLTEDAFDAFCDLSNFLNSNEEMLRKLGEGIIIVTPGNIIVEEYDHE